METAKHQIINWQKIFGALWKKKIFILIISVSCAVLFVIGTYLFVTPEYQADILVYINNKSVSLSGTALSFTTGELTAARQLLDTYIVALKSRACLDAVIEKADLPYSRSQLSNMITAKSVNQTEWFTVVVTSTNPNEARIIADTIAEVFPGILTGAIKGSSVNIVDCAVQPTDKVSPDLTKSGAVGFLLGFIWSCVFVCIREILDDKIHNENTLKELYDAIPVLANIPHKGADESDSKNEYGYNHRKSDKGNTQNSDVTEGRIMLCENLDFATAEAYKLLQTSVQYSFDHNGCKVIGITSSERNEGKSTIAVNLSYMLSCDKQKVLLLEGDMRLPSIAKKLGIASTPGLSELLTGKIMCDNWMKHRHDSSELSVICAGVVPPNPYGLLGSASMDRLLTEFRKCFDYIIVDLPPVNIVSDPLAIAKYLDGFILVVRSDYSTRKGVMAALEKLHMVKTNIIGFVFSTDRGYSGSKYGKYGKYAKYGYSEIPDPKAHDND